MSQLLCKNSHALLFNSFLTSKGFKITISLPKDNSVPFHNSSSLGRCKDKT